MRYRWRFLWVALLLAIGLLPGCVEIAVDVPLPPVAPEVESAPQASETSTVESLPTTASIEVYFTGDAKRARTLESALTAAIDAAHRSIDMAMYNFNLDEVGEALLAAHARGVKVRVVAESDALDGRWFDRFRSAGVEILGDGREALMHNKFLVIDGREVWTGSLNLTETGAYQDDNNLVRFVSVGLAKRYSAVFEAMFTAAEFGPDRSPSGLDPEVDVVGVPIEVYYSPEDRAESRLVDLVRDAHTSIRILAYSFTSNPLADALRDQADAGLEVQGVFDESQADGQGAEYAPFRQAGLDVRLDGNPGLMHHKVIILDDEIVVLGSYNFTRAANQSNDENLIIVSDARIAALYRAEFERIYRQGR